MMPGSFHGTRTMGVAPEPEAAIPWKHATQER
jgi:hypothetical protein